MRWLFLFLLLPTLAWAQEDDRGWIQGLLEDALSGEGRTVKVEGFAGALRSRVTIDRITVADPEGIWLSADDIALVWDRRKVLGGEIDISEITVARIDLPRGPVPVETAPSAAATGAFSLPDLPVSVRLGKLDLQRVSLGEALFGVGAQARVTGQAELAGGEGSAALTVARLDAGGGLSLEGAFDNAARRLKLQLDLEEPEGGIAANLLNLPGRPSVGLQLQGDDPLDAFNATLRLVTDGRERLAGQLQIDRRDAAQMRFSADLGGDLAPVLAPQYRAFLGDDLRLVARGGQSADAITLEEMRLTSAALSLQGSARLAPDGWPQKFDLATRITPPNGESVVLPLSGPELSLGGADLSLKFDAATGEAWSLGGQVQRVRRDGVQIDAVTLEGSGTLSRAKERVEGGLTLSADGLSLADPKLQQAVGATLRGALRFAAQNHQPLRLTDLDLAGEDYALTGDITIEKTPGKNIDAWITPDLALSAQRLERFAPLAGIDLRGAADVTIAGFVQPIAGVAQLDVAGGTQDLATGIAQLDPLLTGRGQLKTTLIRDEVGLEVAPLELFTDWARIEGAAALGHGTGHVTVTAALPDVARALPQLPGAADLSVRATQTDDIWDIRITGDAPGDARVDWQGRVTGDGRSSLQVDSDLSAEIGRLSAYQRLAGRAIRGAATLTARAKGDALAQRFDITANGATRGLDTGIASLNPLLNGTVKFDLAAQTDGPGAVNIDRLELNGPGISGTLSGDLGSGLRFSVKLPELQRIVPDLPGPAQLRGSALRDGSNWAVNANARGPGGITARASGTVAETADRADLSVTGALPLSVVDAQVDAAVISGQARYDLRLRGPLALSSVSGRVSIPQAGVALPRMGVRVQDISGAIALARGRANLGLQGRFDTGGTLQITGPVTLEPPFNANITALLRNVMLNDGRLYETRFGGQVTVTGALAGGAKIGGALDVASLELRLPSLGPSYSVLSGLRHVRPSAPVRRTLRFAGLNQQAPKQRSTSRPYPLNLTINAPARIFVRGRGLDAELGGRVRLTGTTQNVVPVGQFDLIRGRLNLLGQRLTLTEGNVALRGGFDPIIRFVATTAVNDTDIKLTLDGPASAPEITVSAVPDLPQDEALALLLFGRSSAQLSPVQAVRLAAAIRTLSGQGGGLNNDLREGLGVDNLDLNIGDDGQVQVKAGKYISDNVYTDVTVGGDGQSQIELNIDLSRTLKARGRVRSDGNTGIGLFFERDY